MKVLARLSGIMLLLLLFSSQAQAQTLSREGSNMRSRRAFERALEAYRQYDYNLVLQETAVAIARSPSYVSAHLLRAEVLYQLHRYDGSAAAYDNVIDLASAPVAQAYYYGGMAHLKVGRYMQARDYLASFLEMEGASPALVRSASEALVSCAFAICAVQHPVDFKPVNMGPAVNTAFAEYSPSVTADGQTLVFTRRSPDRALAARGINHEVENFYVSYLVDGSWTPAVSLGEPVNTGGNEGAQSLSADGRELYFTACGRQNGFGSCDIYYARRTGDSWSRPVNAGPAINSSSWDSHPSISPDGQSLFFSSARQGSIGEMDIWVSTKDASGQWQAPVNLGAVINTAGREMSPFINPDNQTLYFASDGHTGMGGLDLFYSRRDDQGNWSEPVNLGYPINTHADEFSLAVEAAGIHAWYASDKDGGFGDMDIYTFELYPEAQPMPMTYMKGVVYDKLSQLPLGASFELIDLETGNTIIESRSDPDHGDFLVVVPVHIPMALNVSAPGYLFFSEHFYYDKSRDLTNPYLEDIHLQPVRAGETVILRNVFFETGSYRLDPSSTAELQRLALLLLQNPGIKIQVSGHTDNVGSYDDNLVLSERRARSVVDHLGSLGVDQSRLSFAGFADTRPVDTNLTEEGRANNRRTAFSVIDTSPRE